MKFMSDSKKSYFLEVAVVAAGLVYYYVYPFEGEFFFFKSSQFSSSY